MFVNFFTSNAQPELNKPETVGAIAYNKPKLFTAVPETAGSIASSCSSSSCGSSSSSSGGFSAVA